MSYQAGGRISLNLGGTQYSPRGKFTIDAAGLENKRNDNHDGTVSRTTVSKSVTVKITLDRGKASSGTQRPRWDSAFMLGFYDVTLKETDVRVMHTMSGAFIEGSPELDTETGEVAGLTLVCAGTDYAQVDY